DIIAVTKADGSNRIFAEGARVNYQNALMLFSRKPSGWLPRVMTCSALENKGIEVLWNSIDEYVRATRESGYFEFHRRQQAVIRMHAMIAETLKNSFYNSAAVAGMMPLLEQELYKGKITSYKAAQDLLDKYFGKCP
ncbi:MAG: methylmalonyl Co-A mutase-associated GTPase MeaB, partial [Bacteroidales bacterium]|nr:methylmalonyl Co-A mutase-associated GTPase MeaB [Bacteroidales bacterium]